IVLQKVQPGSSAQNRYIPIVSYGVTTHEQPELHDNWDGLQLTPFLVSQPQNPSNPAAMAKDN
ncbi:MAG: hypothetical protein M1557_02865, partial [Actinobacteria bacterium]|nr:hypothetical protein [Actinomycetota bacterium]